MYRLYDAISSFGKFSLVIESSIVIEYATKFWEKKEEIWISPMTKAHDTPTGMSIHIRNFECDAPLTLVYF